MNSSQKEKVELLLDSDVVEALKACAAEENSSWGGLIEKILGVIHLSEGNPDSSTLDRRISSSTKEQNEHHE